MLRKAGGAPVTVPELAAAVGISPQRAGATLDWMRRDSESVERAARTTREAAKARQGASRPGLPLAAGTRTEVREEGRPAWARAAIAIKSSSYHGNQTTKEIANGR